MSAQTCSLSENSTAFCLVTITGSNQFAWSEMIAGVRPVEAGASIRETATASNPMKTCSERSVLKLAARFA